MVSLRWFLVINGLLTLPLQQKQLQVAVCLVIITPGGASTENQDLLSPNATLSPAVVLKFPMTVVEGQPQSCRRNSREEEHRVSQHRVNRELQGKHVQGQKV